MLFCLMTSLFLCEFKGSKHRRGLKPRDLESKAKDAIPSYFGAIIPGFGTQSQGRYPLILRGYHPGIWNLKPRTLSPHTSGLSSRDLEPKAKDAIPSYFGAIIPGFGT